MHDYDHSAISREEAIALLKYMAEHNKHHTEELHDLSHHFDDEVHTLLHEAVDCFQEGNQKLELALNLITLD